MGLAGADRTGSRPAGGRVAGSEGEMKPGQTGDRQTTPDDPTDFAAVYETFRTAIYGYVRRLVTNPEDAEDLTILAFEKALRAWDRRPAPAELRPWLFRIATNTCLDELRRRQRARWQPGRVLAQLLDLDQVAPDNPEEEVVRRENASVIRLALGYLSTRDRAMLILRECQGLAVAEIAETFGISRGAAKIALFRARERLRAAYLQLGGELPRDYWTSRALAAHASELTLDGSAADRITSEMRAPDE